MQISKCFPLRYKDYYQQAALIETFSGHRELLRSPVDNSWRTHALLCMCSIWILDTWKEHQTEEFLGLVRGPFVLTCNPFMVGAKFKWEYFRDTQCSCTLQWQSGLEIMCGDKSSPRPGPILRYCRVSICFTEARARVSIRCISPQLWTANVQMCLLCRRRWWRGGGLQINSYLYSKFLKL